MHEYIAKFSDMAEHAYNIRHIDDSSQLLTSHFIEGIQKPHVKSKLRSFQIKNLKEIFDFVIQEDQKQKIIAIDFGESSNTSKIVECDIQAIKSNICFKCGGDQHYIKDCPLKKVTMASIKENLMAFTPNQAQIAHLTQQQRH